MKIRIILGFVFGFIISSLSVAFGYYTHQPVLFSIPWSIPFFVLMFLHDSFKGDMVIKNEFEEWRDLADIDRILGVFKRNYFLASFGWGGVIACLLTLFVIIPMVCFNKH